MRTSLKPLITAACFVFTCSSSASWGEEFYRWQDKNGVAHYGSMPPQGISATKVKVYGARAPSQQASAASTSTEVAANSSPQQAVEQPQLKQAQDVECQAERKRLGTLRVNQPIRMKQKDGKLKYLTKEEIAREIQQSQNYLKDACS